MASVVTAAAGRPAPLGRLADLIRGVPISGRLLFGVALLLAAVPLLAPAVPPLIDLPNHMSRYRIGLDYATSPFFHRWFDFQWTLVGNLGVDLLVTAAAPLLGLEGATKAVVMAIPVLTVAGLALIARETHGHVPGTAALAFAFSYNFPFNYGFVNFTLSAALALVVFGGWLRLGRLGRSRLRHALLLPIGPVLWLAHAEGWGMLGVMILAASAYDARRDGASWPGVVAASLRESLPLSLPLVPMLGWMHDAGRYAADIHTVPFDLGNKLRIVFLSLRSDNGPIDVGSVLLACLAIAAAIGMANQRFDRRLLTVAVAIGATYLAIPGILLGASFADMRLTPYMMALFLLTFAPTRTARADRALALAAMAFFVARIACQTATFARLAHAQAEALVALDHVPVGARVFALAHSDCLTTWSGRRMEHLGRMATVRRQAFTNGTWPPPGSQTLRVHADMVRGYEDNGSQLAVPADCKTLLRADVAGALAPIPLRRFDYLWLIDIDTALLARQPWLLPVWHGAGGALYRIAPR